MEGYGFRAGKDKRALVRVATECWVAIHGAASESEEEVPLAQVVTPRPKAAASRKGKGKAKEKEKEADMTPEELDVLFFGTITGDAQLHLRVLRYEPIHWDEFVARAVAAGVRAKGWKDRLRVFLDHQGITFYTAVPGQNRSRQRKRR